MRQPSTFRRRLLRWFDEARRALPWRATSDPYRIWISEIMLQQTRVAAAIPYFERFLERFPTVEALARASEDEVLARWGGLGYYSRARNLRRAAVRIAENGGFPRDYAGWRALPGVGDYTAAAVASIAFNLPHAAVDGNAARVLTRVLGEEASRPRIVELAGKLLDRGRPGAFNQALMELGATICRPRAPRCPECPVARLCRARQEGVQELLPAKRRAAGRVRIEKTLLVIERRGALLLRRRNGFWELPDAEVLPQAVLKTTIGQFRHSVTCHDYLVTVVTSQIRQRPTGYKWVSRKHFKNIPLSTATKKSLVLY